MGVESVSAAVRDARQNAKNNKIKNIKFVAGKAEEVSGELIEKHGKPDVVIVDPPRKGCDPELLQTILDMDPSKIIYVSCNPSTLARDLSMLAEVYRVDRVQPVDLFPHTFHIESVARLTRTG